MPNDPDIYILSTTRSLSDFGLGEVDTNNIFFVNNGPSRLEACRFKNVYVDYMCYKHKNYEACLNVIFRNRDLMEQFGSIILI